ncbi:MAG: helix-turn-helix transcriptional regulator [Caldisericum exile]|uniref:helix-turn-helix transcriptional regulator n=1 Tax=Caldisericum exile TaxID=693075 RepID=UPI003C76481E
MITLEIQKELEELIEKFNNTDRDIIKANLKEKFVWFKIRTGLNYGDVARVLGMSKVTISKMLQLSNYYKPDFYTVLKICNLFGCTIDELFKPVEVYKIPREGSKWTPEKQKQFIKDFEEMDIIEVAEKYEISPRSAVEYYRYFSRELK